MHFFSQKAISTSHMEDICPHRVASRWPATTTTTTNDTASATRLVLTAFLNFAGSNISGTSKATWQHTSYSPVKIPKKIWGCFHHSEKLPFGSMKKIKHQFAYNKALIIPMFPVDGGEICPSQGICIPNRNLKHKASWICRKKWACAFPAGDELFEVRVAAQPFERFLIHWCSWTKV